MKRKVLTIGAWLILLTAPLAAQNAQNAKKSCEELKMEIAAKLDAKGVKNYELNIVSPADVKDQQVVGSCDAGTKKITYKRAG